MNNYKIEGDFDFYGELMKELDTDDSKEDTFDNVCLITNEPLEEMHITLQCKHKFNYLPILHELTQQKKRNYLETTYLGSGQMKCPYCRNVQNGILPKWKLIDHEIQRQHGVNSPVKYVYKPNKCCFEFKSGKKKGMICDESASAKYCDKHVKKYYVDKMKELAKTNNITATSETNAAITTNIVDGCKQILRYGKRKGEPCGCKIYKNANIIVTNNNNTLCKRHYNISISK